MFDLLAWIGGIVAVIAILALNASEQRFHQRRRAALKGWETRRARQAQ